MMWNIPIYTKVTIFWDVMQWSFDKYQCFQGTCCLGTSGEICEDAGTGSFKMYAKQQGTTTQNILILVYCSRLQFNSVYRQHNLSPGKLCQEVVTLVTGSL